MEFTGSTHIFVVAGSIDEQPPRRSVRGINTYLTAKTFVRVRAKIRSDRIDRQLPKASHVHSRRRRHQGHHPRLHRQERHVPFRAGDRLRHEARRRRVARQGRLDPSRPAGLRHGRRSAGENGRRRQRDLRAAGRRGGRDLRGDRRRDAAHRLHHRGHSGPRHGAGQAGAAGLEVDPDRPELPRRHDGGRMQDRHHARQHLCAAAASGSSRVRAR